MKKRNKVTMILMMFCFIAIGMIASSDTAYAKKITNYKQVKKLALKEVKGAKIIEIDKDYEKGVLVWEVDLRKGTKKYELTYRASDGKKLSYGWEEKKVSRSKNKKIISKSECKKLAKKKVKGASITSIKKKRDDGVDVYKIKMQTKSKRYELKYHARTGKLLEYEWDLIIESQKGNKYIGVEKAKKIALKKVPNATVIKVEFDKDDGVPVYEVELLRGRYEYEIKIHAKKGNILKVERERIDDEDDFDDYDYDDYDDDYDDDDDFDDYDYDDYDYDD